MWKDLYGCSADADRQVWADKTTTCTSLCDASKGRVLDLCGMKGVGHDLNTPYQGYPFSVAWDFLSKYTNEGAKKEGKREKEGRKDGRKGGKKEGAKEQV
jgi:poly(3-hydroxybutyrate) depolymerase